jgi:hypothetical protein
LNRFLTFCLIVLTAAPLRAEAFRNPYRIPTLSDPSSVIVADFNGDGLPDIVYGDNSTSPGKLHVLLAQHGAGYLAAPTITLPANVGTGCRGSIPTKTADKTLSAPILKPLALRLSRSSAMATEPL